jgi:hypothetical protein
MNLLATVTEAEAKVVEVVRDLQKPVAGYVQKGVDLAGERLPKISYPSNLPRPGKVLDSQYEFVTRLLSAQYDLLKTVGAKVAPLVGLEPTPANGTKAASSAKAAASTKASATKATAPKATKSSKTTASA